MSLYVLSLLSVIPAAWQCSVHTRTVKLLTGQPSPQVGSLSMLHAAQAIVDAVIAFGFTVHSLKDIIALVLYINTPAGSVLPAMQSLQHVRICIALCRYANFVAHTAKHPMQQKDPASALARVTRVYSKALTLHPKFCLNLLVLNPGSTASSTPCCI